MSNAEVDKNKIEAIDSKEMIRIENLKTRLPHGRIYILLALIKCIQNAFVTRFRKF